MDRNDLIETAEKLKQVDEIMVQEYEAKRDNLVGLVNQKMLARPDILEMVGTNNLEMMKDNHANHARFMESVFSNHSPETLVDTILWVFRAYRSRKFASTYWAAQLNAWIEIYKTELSEECFSAIYPFYNWMQINIPNFVKLSDEKLDAPNLLH